MWAPEIGLEIAEMFRVLGACVDERWLVGVLIDRTSRLAAMQDRERADSAWRKHVSDGRERRRRERMAADPEYAARVRQQQRDAKRRWAERVGKEGLREKWRKQFAARKQREAAAEGGSR